MKETSHPNLNNLLPRDTPRIPLSGTKRTRHLHEHTLNWYLVLCLLNIHNHSLDILQTGYFPRQNGQTGAAKSEGTKLKTKQHLHSATEGNLSNGSAKCWANYSLGFPAAAPRTPAPWTPSIQIWRIISHTIFSFLTLKLYATMTKCSRCHPAPSSHLLRSMLSTSMARLILRCATCE